MLIRFDGRTREKNLLAAPRCLRPTPYNVLAARAQASERQETKRLPSSAAGIGLLPQHTEAARAYAIIILNIYNIENDHHVMKSSKEPHDTYKE